MERRGGGAEGRAAWERLPRMGRRLLWKRSRGAAHEKAKGQPGNFLKEKLRIPECVSHSLGSSSLRDLGVAAPPWEPGGMACLWLPPGPWSGPFIRNICSSWLSMSQGGLRAPCNFQAGVGLWGQAASTIPLQKGGKAECGDTRPRGHLVPLR